MGFLTEESKGNEGGKGFYGKIRMADSKAYGLDIRFGCAMVSPNGEHHD
jgi:hypothetical protein